MFPARLNLIVVTLVNIFIVSSVSTSPTGTSNGNVAYQFSNERLAPTDGEIALPVPVTLYEQSNSDQPQETLRAEDEYVHFSSQHLDASHLIILSSGRSLLTMTQIHSSTLLSSLSLSLEPLHVSLCIDEFTLFLSLAATSTICAKYSDVVQLSTLSLFKLSNQSSGKRFILFFSFFLSPLLSLIHPSPLV